MDTLLTASKTTVELYKLFASTQTSEILFKFFWGDIHFDAIILISSPTGKLLLFSSSDDNSVRVHDLMQKKAHCIVTFSEHVSVPTQICATSDSSLIVSVGRDKVLINTLVYALTYVHTEIITRYPLKLSCW